MARLRHGRPLNRSGRRFLNWPAEHALEGGPAPEQLRQGFIIAVLQFHDAPLRLNEAYERNPPAHIRVLGGVHILAGHWEQFLRVELDNAPAFEDLRVCLLDLKKNLV